MAQSQLNTTPGRGDLGRYPMLYGCFLRYCLVREMSFRVNFLTRCVATVFWAILLVSFFHLIFLNTQSIGDWTKNEYLFFMGTGMIVNSLLNTLFLENCTNLSALIRSGDLDFALVKPIDEQFLLSCQKVDWAALPNVAVGISLLTYASLQMSEPVTAVQAANYVILLLAGVAVMYSLMLAMASTSVWIVRNRGLYEMWFYVTQFARYPADIYGGNVLGITLNLVLMFVLPILLAVTVPARYGIHKLQSGYLAAYLLCIAVVFLVGSRWFFRFSLSRYRSASS